MNKNFTKCLVALTALGALCGCDNKKNDNKGNELAGDYKITVWCDEKINSLTGEQIKKFEAANEGIKIDATIENVGEGDAATNMITDVEKGADVYCFAQDQFARLVSAGALANLGKQASADLKAANDDFAVAAATSGEELYAYPLTADNGYFMYYDKSVITDANDLKDVAKLVAKCEEADRYFCMENESSAWYIASWFFGAGCHSTWAVDNDGKFLSVDDDFDSAKGIIACKGMAQLVKSTKYKSSSKASEFENEGKNKAAIVISGTWDYVTAKRALGDDLGVAELPSYTVDGHAYHMGSYAGCKLLGVKPQQDVKRAAVLQKLALFLTNKESQLERFESVAWGPSNKEAQQDPKVQENAALKAFYAQKPYAVKQGQIHGSWWDIAKVIATGIKEAADDTAMQAVLTKYHSDIDQLFTMTDEERNGFTVIGSINDTGWATDFAMTKVSDGVWKTTEAYTLRTSGATSDSGADEFKVRQGKSWDVAYGTNGNNFVVETAGTYYIQLTVEGNVGTIALIPAAE